MELQGNVVVTAGPWAVWDSIRQAETLPAWIPGCIEARWQDEETVTAVVQQRVGMLRARVTLTARVVTQSPPEHLKLSGAGEDRALGSRVRVELELKLVPLDGGSTRVEYGMTVQVAGRLASLGHFVIQQHLKTVEKEFQARVQGLFTQGG